MEEVEDIKLIYNDAVYSQDELQYLSQQLLVRTWKLMHTQPPFDMPQVRDLTASILRTLEQQIAIDRGRKPVYQTTQATADRYITVRPMSHKGRSGTRSFTFTDQSRHE